MTDSCILPAFERGDAAAIARRLWSLEGEIKALDGERDLNFLITTAGGKFVFKIANAEESPAMLECQHQVFRRLADARVFARNATAQPSVNGRSIEFVETAGAGHACRVLPFIEGRMLIDVGRPGTGLLDDLGRRLARLDRALQAYAHPALERPLLWRMDRAPEVLAEFKPLLPKPERRQLVEHFESAYRESLLPRLDRLRRSVIHNDANRANVLVDDAGERVVSVIDFGDMIESWLAVEPALAATYAMLEQPDPLGIAATLLRGYHGELALTRDEAAAVYDFICMRLCMSVCICAHQLQFEPDNDYLSIDIEPAWRLLAELRDMDQRQNRARLLAACGY